MYMQHDNSQVEYRCYGEIKCPNGLKLLVDTLADSGFQTSYREAFGGRNFTAKITFPDADYLETLDSDGNSCNFTGDFKALDTAKRNLSRLSRELSDKQYVHRFELYSDIQQSDEPLLYFHYHWPRDISD